MGSAVRYLEITKSVDAIIASGAGNDIERSCYMIARSALLRVRAAKGSREAAKAAYALADELATEP